jgi:RNA polymerase sigma-70 factor (ECF subfamily)
LEDGQKDLFGLIVKNYRGMVFSRAYSITKDVELGKEVAQQTFIRAYTHLDTWNGTELGTWLSTIAAHEAINLMEKEKRKVRVDDVAALSAHEGYSAERERQLSVLEHAIDELPEQDRKIIRLHYYDNVKTEDIATRINLSHTNVLVRLHRIREKLKKKLQNGE